MSKNINSEEEAEFCAGGDFFSISLVGKEVASLKLNGKEVRREVGGRCPSIENEIEDNEDYDDIF